jgi:flavin reductase (DIM6/NTAB) family NADH-FMN oxidoreductase RutF
MSATTPFVSLDPAALSQTDNYKLMIGAIVPRPIAFVSTVSPEGLLNVAPFSFFNGVCSNPPTLLFTTVRRSSDGQKKDTLTNIEATQEFVVNVVSEAMAVPMNQASAEYPPDVSEFDACGLTPAPSSHVRPAGVAESPVRMECRLLQVVHIGNDAPGSGDIVIGQIVAYHLRADVYAQGRVSLEALRPIGRLAGAAYCRVTDVFTLERPSIPSQAPSGSVTSVLR